MDRAPFLISTCHDAHQAGLSLILLNPESGQVGIFLVILQLIYTLTRVKSAAKQSMNRLTALKGASAGGGDDAEQVCGQLDGGGAGPLPEEGAEAEPEPRGGAEPLHGLDAAGRRGRARRPAAARGRRRRAEYPH